MTATRTTDHDTIRQWVEERQGRPAAVEATMDKDDAGILRIDFPIDGMDEGLTEISWEQFFQKFDENNLEFLYDEEEDDDEDGELSRFCKFVRKAK
jgi:hypothetical protein